MTVEQAIRILDPETSVEALAELENLEGVDRTDYVLGQVREACEMACNIMKQYLRDQVVMPM